MFLSRSLEVIIGRNLMTAVVQCFWRQTSARLYQLAQQKVSKMEDIPAGRITATSNLADSPRKASNPIGIQSQWSFGWQGNNTKEVVNRPNNSKGFNLYHNQSSISFGEEKTGWRAEQPLKNSDKKKKESPMVEKPVWNYNPKTAGKTTMVLGTEKTDYRKKDEVNKERTPTALTKSRKKQV